MRYDFDTIIDRSACGSSKWEGMKKLNPNVGPGVLPMSVADMEFMTAPEIREGLKTYIDTVIQGYTGPTEAYYDAVLAWQRRRHGCELKKDWIITTSGVVSAIFSLVSVLTQPGEGVIIQQPVYYPFSLAAKLTGRKLVNNPLIRRDDTYDIDFEDLEAKAKDPNNKVLIFCNPHNPIGKVWSKADIRRLVDICVANGVFIIDDEIHNDLIMPGHTHHALPTVCPDALSHCAYCTAPSKTFNLAGMQLSNIFVANPEVRGKLMMQKMLTMSMSQVAISYEACRLAYDLGEPWLEELLTVIDGNAKFVTGFLGSHIPEARVYPLEGTYLLWVDFRGLGMTHKELEAMNLRADLYLDEGAMFGPSGRGFERFNLALPRSALEKAMERLLKAWQETQANWAQFGKPEHTTLEAGMTMPNFTFHTPTESGLDFRAVTAGKPAIVLFHRYFSCPLCGEALYKLSASYSAIGAQVLVVLESTPESIPTHPYPFRIVCDPERRLYDRFNVFTADSSFDLLGEDVSAVLKQYGGLVMGSETAEGDQNQLPAWFAIDRNGTIVHAHYGRDVFDVPTPEEMASVF